MFGSAEISPGQLRQSSSQSSAAFFDSLIVGESEAETGETIAGQHIAHLLVGVGEKGPAGNESHLFFNRPIEE